MKKYGYMELSMLCMVDMIDSFIEKIDIIE